MLQVNASIDGLEWHKVGEVLGLGEEKTAHRQITPTNARCIRLIPLTDRKMPVCIRTEIFGCYRKDSLNHYKLSKAPRQKDENLNSDLVGIGQLTNEDITDFMVFEPSKLKIDFDWEKPKNISSVTIYLRAEGCLKEVSIHLPGMVKKHELYCDLNKQKLSFAIGQMVTRISISFQYSRQLYLSEIVWNDEKLDETNFTPVKSVNLEAKEMDLLAVFIVSKSVFVYVSIKTLG